MARTLLSTTIDHELKEDLDLYLTQNKIYNRSEWVERLIRVAINRKTPEQEKEESEILKKSKQEMNQEIKDLFFKMFKRQKEEGGSVAISRNVLEGREQLRASKKNPISRFVDRVKGGKQKDGTTRSKEAGPHGRIKDP